MTNMKDVTDIIESLRAKKRKIDCQYLKFALEEQVDNLLSGKETQHMLLSGPPFSGKTELLNWITRYAKAKGLEVREMDARSPYTGMDTALLKIMSESNKKYIVMQEELDSFLSGRSNDFREEFMGYLSKGNILFLATTNFPEKIEEPVRQRFYNVQI